MQLSMIEQTPESLQRGDLLTKHRGRIWIDADNDPCIVVGDMLSLSAWAIETGRPAAFPLRPAYPGTKITIFAGAHDVNDA